MITVFRTLGDKDILTLPMTGFLCSRRISAISVLRSYDWAIQQAKEVNCVIGGFHSKIEKDVLHFLLKGNQPLVIVLARGFYKRWQPEIKARLDKGNLLIISPFEDSVKKVTPQTCLIRNKLIIDLADKLVIGHVNPEGTLAKIISDTTKPIEFLDSYK